MKLSEKMAVKYSDIVIGDNKGITDYIKSEYSKIVQNKRVKLIAYGGDQVSRVQDDSLFERYPLCREPYSVTVCRIEPENNVHVILEAFSEMLDETLVFVGNWEKSEDSRSLKEKFSVCKNIHLLAPIYELHIVNWLRSNSHVYIHGHSAGGTNPSLVEAMNLSIPILAFDCVYNRATTEEKCLYWKIAEDLQNLMKNKSGKFAEIAREMGEAGKRLYSWERIARQYNALYQ
ncbi:glycosyltransferase [Treponema succinifaciens]|uniref:glycosyltransferase n=2 Tax=Treponema TaxID=157 RepID=UPI0023F1C882|nr:glycosyltransferase [Treponema succinifaciens]